MEMNTTFRRLSDQEFAHFQPFITRWLKYIGSVIGASIAIRMITS